MTGETPPRSVALAIGHIVFAPLTALWIGILAATAIARMAVRDWSPAYATPAGASWVLMGLGGTGVLLFVLPLSASLMAGSGFLAGARSAWRVGRLLAGATIAAIVNGFVWTEIARRSGSEDADRGFPPRLLEAAALSLAWSSFVLWRSSRVLSKAPSGDP